MISIIVCSQVESLFNAFNANISNTIETAYEIIRIDNSTNQYGICEAYNIGAKKAVYPILCFVHEDVTFETKGWGKIVKNYFENQEIGVLGVAGCSYRSYIPTSWCANEKYCYKNFIQGYKYSNKSSTHEVLNLAGRPAKVVVIDGVFIATRKTILEKHQFDQTLLKGFHSYDIDFCMQVITQTSYSILVVPDILLVHYSEGNTETNWIKSAQIISKKWKKSLPVSINNLSFSEQRKLHWQALLHWISRLERNDISKDIILINLFKYSLNKYFHLISFLRLFKGIILN